MKKTAKILSIILALAMLVTFFQVPAKNAYANTDPDEVIKKRLNNAVVLYIGSSDACVNNKMTQVDKTNPEVTPVFKNGRSLVPIRFISESFGAKVDWDQSTSTVTAKIEGLKGKTVRLVLGSNKININGKDTTIDVPAERINGRVFVPFRVVSEAFGKKVFYDRGLIIIADKENLFDTKTEKSLIDKVIARVNNLPFVGSEEKLKELLSKSDSYTGYNRNKGSDIMNEKSMDMAASESVGTSLNKAAKSMSAVTSGDYSTTNVQVQGVDEADVVKTDGKYIYQVNNQRIVVAEAYPAEEMNIVSKLDFTQKNFNPSEMYIDDKHLVVIGSSYTEIPIYKTQIGQPEILPPYYSRNFIKAIVYDITDRTNLKQLREVELEGNYVSSRKIGSALYLVANKYANYYYIQQGNDNLTPSYRDTAVDDKVKNVSYEDIRYFPGCVSPNYMLIAGINLDNNEEQANISTYLGSGENIYASQDNLYVAITNYNYTILKAETQSIRADVNQNNTTAYKFSLDKGKVTYLGKGEVPGRILNQFSMDEHDGNFRIATTTGEMWRSDEFTSKNNVYILNDTLSIIGRLEDIAPGERIYSTRFMGDRGYMVTYRQVDPLFVIDLNPENPKVLGALKIPGYSDYLHPYDENHIIGFGKDTEETKNGGALMQGMKIAVFDVSDVNNPKEKFKETIGDRGTDSELLRNHKALLFSKEKNLLAFPITVVNTKARNLEELISGNESYQTVWQGAYVYSLDLKNGFKLKGRITHILEEEYKKSGDYWYSSEKNIERLLYIDDTLYTLSKAMFKAHTLSDLKEIKTLEIK